MANRVKNEFTLEKRKGKIYAKRIFEDEYDIDLAFKLIDDTIGKFSSLVDFVNNFEEILPTQLERVSKGFKGKPEDLDKHLAKVEEQWRNTWKIDKESTLPELINELPQYINLAAELNYPIDMTQIDNYIEK